MDIPSIQGLFAERVGSAMGRLPGSLSSLFDSQLAAAQSAAADGEAQELTILEGAEGGGTIPLTADQILTIRSTASQTTRQALPLYIPAASLSVPGMSEGSAALAQEILDFASQFVGTPYVFGGEDLQNGVDCSGFTQAVFDRFGIKLPRSAYRQSMVGTEVDPQNLVPGDLLYFKTDDYAPVTHVALYMGDGKIIHAASKKTGVIISNLKIKDDFVIARRVLGQ